MEAKPRPTGRKPRDTVQLNIRLLPSERAALHQAAAARGVAVAQLLRNGLALQGIALER